MQSLLAPPLLNALRGRGAGFDLGRRPTGGCIPKTFLRDGKVNGESIERERVGGGGGHSRTESGTFLEERRGPPPGSVDFLIQMT